MKRSFTVDIYMVGHTLGQLGSHSVRPTYPLDSYIVAVLLWGGAPRPKAPTAMDISVAISRGGDSGGEG